jgi:hypothetical protein
LPVEIGAKSVLVVAPLHNPNWPVLLVISAGVPMKTLVLVVYGGQPGLGVLGVTRREYSPVRVAEKEEELNPVGVPLNCH